MTSGISQYVVHVELPTCQGILDLFQMPLIARRLEVISSRWCHENYGSRTWAPSSCAPSTGRYYDLFHQPHAATTICYIAHCSVLIAPSSQLLCTANPFLGPALHWLRHPSPVLSSERRSEVPVYPSGMWAPTGFVQGEGFGIIVDRLLKDLKSASYCGATLVR